MIPPQRSAAASVPLMTEWICRTVDFCQWLALVDRAFQLGAVVFVGRLVLLDERFAVTADSAAAEFRAEALQRVCVDLSHGLFTEDRLDVPVDVVHVPSRALSSTSLIRGHCPRLTPASPTT